MLYVRGYDNDPAVYTREEIELRHMGEVSDGCFRGDFFDYLRVNDYKPQSRPNAPKPPHVSTQCQVLLINLQDESFTRYMGSRLDCYLNFVESDLTAKRTLYGAFDPKSVEVIHKPLFFVKELATFTDRDKVKGNPFNNGKRIVIGYAAFEASYKPFDEYKPAWSELSDTTSPVLFRNLRKAANTSKELARLVNSKLREVDDYKPVFAVWNPRLNMF